MIRFFSLVVLFFGLVFQGTAQQSPVYSHYFINPVLVNPSFTGSSGFTDLSLNYRNQWAGIEGAPSTINAILQLPLSTKVSMGMNLLSDKRGALSTYETAVMTSYHLPLSKDIQVNFGLQLGVGRNSIDFSGADLAIDRAMENNWYATGSFGMNVSLGRLKLAFAMPELFENDILNQSNFEELGLDVMEQTLSSVSYNFELSPQWSLEPYALLRTDKEGKSQWEAAGVVTYKGFAWIGATYREDGGVGGLVGLSVNDWLRFSYAYEASSQMVSGFGNGSHEIQLNFRLGKRNKRIDAQKQPLITTAQNSEDPADEEINQSIQDEPVEEEVIAAAAAPSVQEAIVKEKHEEIQNSEDVESISLDYDTEKELADNDGSQMEPGYYVVVGAFKIPENADRYNAAVQKKGYTSAMGYSRTTGFTYIYIMHTDSENQAKDTTRSIKKIKTLYFPEAWVLHIRS
ncbi:PorP/SprF family type IX secretion system membrane protein [Fulvivirga sedimenti]|uniref:PorP/SprF family type IX secretion system membrane protein n=1 Tax=Fulvivirga sedimenti TaxID=2879465 RepID=A0A9X1HV06_9BACT|nr:PorP/SprF family type IX secretion system membrane protein [Fulvivirga sedimenti]MCA6078778.1 PorP/SprF family type IX secretion system membrane protein [Fulvivirga sedimenti]